MLIFLEKNRLSCLIAHKRSFFFSLNVYLSFFVKCSNPIKFNVSVNKICLIFLSIGEEELRDGQTLTSIIHGFRLLSISISNPYNSNPQFLLYCVFECISNITGYAEIHVFIRIPLISSNNFHIIKNYLLYVNSSRLVKFSQRSMRPFRSFAILLLFCVFNKVFWMLINTKIC